MNKSLSETGEKLIKRAQSLLQERGYQFLSFQDLADALSIRKASVHYYFRTKEDLARAMIDGYRVQMAGWLEKIEKKNQPPQERLKLYFELFFEASKKGKHLCPAGALLLDWHSFSKEAQNDLVGLITLHRKFLEKLLEDSVSEGSALIEPSEIKSHVMVIGTSIQGGLQLARSSSDPALYLTRLFAHLERITFKQRKAASL